MKLPAPNMSEAVPFRSPVAEPASAVPTPSDTSDKSTYRAGSRADDVPVPPSLYKELEGKSYAIKHLGLDLYADDSDFGELRDQASELDAYVLKQIKARGLKDDAASYKEVIGAIYKHIGKSPNEDPIKSLKRLTVAAGAISRLESAKIPPILSASNLTPTEFEEVHG